MPFPTLHSLHPLFMKGMFLYPSHEQPFNSDSQTVHQQMVNESPPFDDSQPHTCVMCTQCCTCTPLRGHPRERTAKRHGLFHLTEGEDSPQSSPSQMGGLLSVAPASPLTIVAELVTLTASKIPSFPVKEHLTLLAGGWFCKSPSGDRFLTPGGQAAGGVEDKGKIT